MKIAFDEHIPPTLVKIFQSFATDKQLLRLTKNLTIEKAQDYYPKPGDADYLKRSDVPWVKRFAAAGGQVVISGNTKMKINPHERFALVQEGMIVVFFENRWNQWLFWSKCSLLLHWWPIIIKQIKSAKKGSFFHVPSEWSDPNKERRLRAVSNEDLKLQKMERQKADGSKIRAERAARREALKKKPALRLRDLVDLMNEGKGADVQADAEKIKLA